MKKIIIVALSVLVVLVAFLGYSGFFTSVVINEEIEGPYVFVGKEYLGDYALSGKRIDSLSNDLKTMNIDVSTSFGIYRNNPEVTPVDNLKSMLGIILQTKDSLQILSLKRSGFVVLHMGQTKSMIVDFPNRTPLSLIASILKVYPELKKYRKKNNYLDVAVLEVYTENAITISMEIQKLDE